MRYLRGLPGKDCRSVRRCHQGQLGLADLAVEHGCEIVTLDRDFARFESIRHQRPELSYGS